MLGVCINKKDGRLIELLGGAYTDNEELANQRLVTLKQNAFISGYQDSEIDVKWVSEEEGAALLAAATAIDPKPTLEDRVSALEDALVSKAILEASDIVVPVKPVGKLEPVIESP